MTAGRNFVLFKLINLLLYYYFLEKPALFVTIQIVKIGHDIIMDVPIVSYCIASSLPVLSMTACHHNHIDMKTLGDRGLPKKNLIQ